MRNKWVVVTDLGSFKAYKVEQAGAGNSPRLELVESFDNSEVHAHLSEKLTDQAGQFARGSRGAGANHEASSGERHNIELEQRRRWIRQVADRVSHVLRRSDVDCCWFAAGKEINHQLCGELAAAARAKIEKNVSANLTKVDKSELLRHF